MQELRTGDIISCAICIRSLDTKGQPGTIWYPTVVRDNRISNAKLDGALDRQDRREKIMTCGVVTQQLRRPTCHPQRWDNVRDKWE